MRFAVRVLLLAAVLLPGVAPAAASALQVRDAAIATAVVDRAPVGAGERFPADVGRLYAFTRIVGASGDTEVKHVWYYAGKVMAQVDLPVRSLS
ncbi:MAG: hypothetical protein Kow0092_13870 [Deferrisomatales bacterium]